MYKYYKFIFFSLSLVSFTIQSNASSIHQVPMASSGNTIELTICNNTSFPLNKIVAQPQDVPAWMNLETGKNEIDRLSPSQEKQVTFTFSLDKQSPMGETKTLAFMIKSANGESWLEELKIKVSAPQQFKLAQNYPNPFNPKTTIGYFLPQKGKITFAVYTVLGQQVNCQVNKNMEPGYYETIWDGGKFASGTYIIKLLFEDIDGHRYVQQKKMLLLK